VDVNLRPKLAFERKYTADVVEMPVRKQHGNAVFAVSRQRIQRGLRFAGVDDHDIIRTVCPEYIDMLLERAACDLSKIHQYTSLTLSISYPGHYWQAASDEKICLYPGNIMQRR
jgi:hypothetical protein